MQKQLISELSGTLETKTVSADERGLTSTEWTEYAENTRRIQKSVAPTSSVTARTVTVDGFMLSQQNYAGITETAARSYTATGMNSYPDGRPRQHNNDPDRPGRARRQRDGGRRKCAVTQYDPRFDLPSVVTDALGNTVCAGYDARGRKTAEWGTGTQSLLIYYNYRHLNPHDGRCISRDPIKEQGGWNLFAYVKNQPIFLKDYVGLILWGQKR